MISVLCDLAQSSHLHYTKVHIQLKHRAVLSSEGWRDSHIQAYGMQTLQGMGMISKFIYVNIQLPAMATQEHYRLSL